MCITNFLLSLLHAFNFDVVNTEHECSYWHSRSRIDVHHVCGRRGILYLLYQVLTFKVCCYAS